jgi:hypothetical protein
VVSPRDRVTRGSVTPESIDERLVRRAFLSRARALLCSMVRFVKLHDRRPSPSAHGTSHADRRIRIRPITAILHKMVRWSPTAFETFQKANAFDSSDSEALAASV